MNFNNITSIIALILSTINVIISIVAIIVAIKIPKKIMWFQLYTSLSAEYRSHAYAQAVKSITDFFVDECENDLTKIKDKYSQRFDTDFKNEELNSEKILHFQRRLLSQYYFQLDECISNCKSISKLIKTEYTSAEIDLVNILYYMNKAVSEDSKIYKNIKPKNRTDITNTNENNMQNHLLHIYEYLKKELGK